MGALVLIFGGSVWAGQRERGDYEYEGVVLFGRRRIG
jgi:hypothetical protein